MGWTPQQENAIKAKGRSVIVSAAAGSGKTSVLIEKLIKIISDSENRVNVEDMIVVTFTNAAAAEMKQRLSTALIKKISENPDDRWLLRQQSHMGLASISTIHSFCFNLIRENISNLSLSADFRILDETEQALCMDTILKEVVEERHVTNPDEMKLLRDNFCGNNDKPLLDIISSLYTDITAIPFYENRIRQFMTLYDGDFYLKKYLSGTEKNLSSYTESLTDLIDTAVSLGDKKLSEVLDDDMNILKKSSELFTNDGFTAMADYLSGIKFKTFPRAPKDNPYPEEREFVKNKRTEIKKNIQSLSAPGSIVENSGDDLDRHKKILTAIYGIIKELDKRLSDYKTEKNAIGFDDAEQITLRLLAVCDENGCITKTPLCQQLSESYAIIMVDEYQDSNDRQDMIFRLLSKNGDADTYGNNLFFVGDVKQSIYRFRLANPDNFIRITEKFQPYDENNNKNASIKLSRNFRSSPQVIDFVNYVFRNIMSVQSGDIDYTEDEFLINGTDFFENNRDTHIMLIDKTDKAENSEALCIAEKIRKMLDDGVPVADRKNGGTRPCEMKDFCILMRNKKYNGVYRDALETYGLDVNCEDVSGYLKSREISILLNLLRVTDNPLQDIPLTSVLMSPMFTVTADEIAQLRLIGRGRKLFTNILAALGKFRNTPAVLDSESALFKKLENFHGIITELRLISSWHTLPEIIQLIYDKTDFTSVISLYKDAERKRANLRILLEYANSCEASGGGGIGGFIRYIDRISESKGDFRPAGGSSGTRNAVSVMTMHKSKGLEFPFVFIAQSDTPFSTLDAKKPYQFSSDYGIGFKLQNKERYEKFKTIPYEVIGSHNNVKMIGEEMRLLYVALTRAKERLFITLDVSEKNMAKAGDFSADIYKNKGITPSLSVSANSMNDWLLMTLVSHPKAAALRERFEIFESFRYKDDFPLSFEECTPSDKYEELKSVSADTDTADDSLTAEALGRAFDFEYDDRLVNVISKLSVSDISKMTIHRYFCSNVPILQLTTVFQPPKKVRLFTRSYSLRTLTGSHRTLKLRKSV